MLIAASALIAAPASAQAITVSGTAAPTDTAAGAHSDFQIHIDFSGSGAAGQVKNLTVGLPPGMVGNPNATPKCTPAQLHSDPPACPANSQVGEVSAMVKILGLLPLPPVPGKLYNLQPGPGEPARFGIVLSPPALPPIVLESGVQLRSDFGLNTVINGIPNTTIADGDTTITSQDITLYGSRPWMSAPFMRDPTSCGQKTTTFAATAWDDSADDATASFSVQNCGALDFSPSFSATVGGSGQTKSGIPTTVVTSIDQGADEAGLVKAQVAVPPDFNPNATLLGNSCPQASFLAHACAPGAVVGSAVAASPLLTQPLTGPVLLVNAGGALPNVGLDLQGQLNLLLQGTLDATKTTTFDGLPDIPISHFQLTFSASAGLLGNARDLCVPPSPLFHAAFQGYNGASSAVDVPATVVGCGASAKAKCKKAKKHRKKHHRAAESKKKHKHKKKCKRKKRKKHHRR
ncbi:MAG TPA: hypothetical protein VH501_05795 [Solirubrobacterales bacterium]